MYGCMKDDSLQLNTLSEVDIEFRAEEAPLIAYQGGELIPNQYIVVFKEDAFPNQRRMVTKENYPVAKAEMATEAQKVLQSIDIPKKELLQTYVKTLKGVALQLSEQEVAELRKDSRVAYIEQDQVVRIGMGGPPGNGGGGGGGDPAETTPPGIGIVNGGTTTASGTAWIIDSGIDLDHPDLNVDVGRSESFLSGNQGNNPDDQNGHGTHVAGTVAAIAGNGIGVVGVSPGSAVVSVRVLDRRGSGSTSGVIGGVDYVGANAGSGDAANMSLGGGVSTTLDNAVIDAAGSNGCNCPFVLAAGNESQHASNSSPARANGPNIYTIASMTLSGGFSSFSNYGQPPVDYIAPGSGILSTWKNGGYNTISGTSMAAPHACGVLLLGNISNGGSVSGPGGNYTIASH